MYFAEFLIIALFVGYFVLHSLTAGVWLKRLVATRYPSLLPYYRLCFNALAMLLAIPLLYVMWRYPGEPLWQWEGWSAYLANGLAVLAVIAFVYSLRMYDMSEFWGVRQLRERSRELHDLEQFKISTFHRFVRHPWYSLMLVILWSRDISTTQLVAYSLVTLYIIVGSRLEERKLVAYHGKVYEDYRQRVPGLIPRPWRYLSTAQTQELLTRYGKP